MLELHQRSDGQVIDKSELTLPVIYLDHWALVDFSNKKSFQEKFISSLKTKGGTLVLSQINFFEAANFDNLNQAQRIEDFLDQLLPNIHVIDFSHDPMNFPQTGGAEYASKLDKLWFINFLAEIAAMNGGRLTFKTLFTMIIENHSKLHEEFVKLKAEATATLNHAIHSPEMLEKALIYIPTNDQRPFNLLSSAYLRSLQRHREIKLSEYDSIDFLHVISANLISDFALFDRRWCHRTDEAERYLKAHDMWLRFPSRYWGNPKHIDRFFGDLNAFDA